MRSTRPGYVLRSTLIEAHGLRANAQKTPRRRNIRTLRLPDVDFNGLTIGCWSQLDTRNALSSIERAHRVFRSSHVFLAELEKTLRESNSSEIHVMTSVSVR